MERSCCKSFFFFFHVPASSRLSLPDSLRAHLYARFVISLVISGAALICRAAVARRYFVSPLDPIVFCERPWARLALGLITVL